jgi:hypothetical protein
MKKMVVKIFGAVLFGLVSISLFFGCQEEPDSPSPAPKDQLNHDIYVSFYYEDLKKGGGNRVAAYWHNDSIVTLSDNSVDAYANGIFVDGEDVYVVGSSGGAAVYWKNGVERILPQGAIASSIYIRDGKVYICGCNNSSVGSIVPMCWIDESPIVLKGGMCANSIFVDEEDSIHIAGYGKSQYSDDIIYYWEGLESDIADNYSVIGGTKMKDQNNSTSAYGISATADGSSVIVCGVETDNAAKKFIAKQWINRRGHPLTVGENGTEARSVFVEKDVFYVAGKMARTACYWQCKVKSDKMTVDKSTKRINELTSGKTDTYATSIFVKDGTVYVVGYEAGAVINRPLLWRGKQGLKFLDSEAMNLDVTTTGLYVKNRAE